MKLKSIAAAALTLLAATVSHAQTVLRTVQVYDAATNANVVDLLDVAAPLNYPAFTGGIAANWGVNRAGVVNFDPTSFVAPWVFPSVGQLNLRALYGVASLNNLGMFFSRPADVAGTVGGAVPISSIGTLRVPAGAPFIIKLVPSVAAPLRTVGFTLLQQQTQQKVQVQWIQGGGAPPIVTGMLVPVGPIPTRDVCFARQTTSAAGIIGVQITIVNALTGAPVAFCIDDFGFSH